MRRFIKLFHNLGNTSSTSKKVDLIANYFEETSTVDRNISLYILSGGNLKRQVTSTELRKWAAEFSSIPTWLFEESYHVVGDLAETISLLCRSQVASDSGSLESWVQYLKELKGKSESERRAEIFNAWSILSQEGIIVFNKLLTAGLRIGVSKGLVIKALSKATNLPETLIAQRLSGQLTLDKASYDKLLEKSDEESLNPYPFYLAYSLEMDPELLGPVDEWSAEWKWDGIRGQIVIRKRRLALWSRGEELLTESFPEFASLLESIPDGTVLDGEIIGWKDGEPLPFAALQKRITRKKVTPSLLTECPVAFLAYDLIEKDFRDIRDIPHKERRQMLAVLVKASNNHSLQIPDAIDFKSWEQLADIRKDSRKQKAEGVMLKKRSSSYQVGRKRGSWWKWKVDPLTIDGVLIYAQKGHGRRADLYTDYTFGVWQNDKLVPITKAYSGLTDKEFREVDSFIKNNVVEKFGPVRTVKPELVFEIAFEGIQASSRHKSGIALRFPRMARWRKDKPASEADTLQNVEAILKGYHGP